MKILAACLIVAAGIVSAIGGSYWLSLRALRDSDQALCPVLELVTRRPVPSPAGPAASPSRVQEYELYAAARHAEHRYRCS